MADIIKEAVEDIEAIKRAAEKVATKRLVETVMPEVREFIKSRLHEAADEPEQEEVDTEEVLDASEGESDIIKVELISADDAAEVSAPEEETGDMSDELPPGPPDEEDSDQFDLPEMPSENPEMDSGVGSVIGALPAAPGEEGISSEEESIETPEAPAPSREDE